MEKTVQSQRSQETELGIGKNSDAVGRPLGCLAQGYDFKTPFHEGSQTASFQISPEIPLPR